MIMTIAKPVSAIERSLEQLHAERALRLARPGLQQQVLRVKAYQCARFESCYSDVLAAPDTQAAARFFLKEIYGPADYSLRDTQFARVAPTMARRFPGILGELLVLLAELNALSEVLDTQMALTGAPMDANHYGLAWRAVGRSADREWQIATVVRLGHLLVELARGRMLRSTLRLMRAPASAMGLQELQRVLEDGLDAFAAMKDPKSFVATVAARESAFAKALFAG
jgi:hypothetical protein